MVLQSATQATLVNLVEQHITSLVREAAVVNRHSKRGGKISAGDDDDGDYSYINKNNMAVHHHKLKLKLKVGNSNIRRMVIISVED